MAAVERVPRTRGWWIAVVLLVVAAMAVVIIALLWRSSRPTAVTTTVAADAGPKPRRPDRGTPDVGPPPEPALPAKKAERAPTRRLSDRELRDIQRRGQPLLRSCVQRQRLGSADARKVTVLVQLADGGRVSSVAVDTGGDPALADCLRRMVASWRFPSDVRAQKVVFPVVLAGGE